MEDEKQAAIKRAEEEARAAAERESAKKIAEMERERAAAKGRASRSGWKRSRPLLVRWLP